MLTFDFITGMKLGIEFPGGGLHCVLDLLIVRIVFCSEEYLEDAQE